MASTVSTVSPPTSPKPAPSLLKEEETTTPSASEENDATHARQSLDNVEHEKEIAETKPASPPPTKPLNGITPTVITVFSADSPYSEPQSLPPISPRTSGITFAATKNARPSSIIISGNDHSHSYGFTNHSPGHSPSQTHQIPAYMQDNASSIETQKPTHSRHRSSVSTDVDAQEMVIASLRQQILDLSTQVSQLNSKLITSYDRVSDLEDSLHVSDTQVKSSKTKIQELEVERSQHLSALNTGLLVEKSHVTSELTRLMDKATEEAAQRGQAENARIAIEQDLDDLSAQLFGQANSMVAEARFEKHLSERKVEEAEKALKGAEDAVRVMQMQMQTMLEEREIEEKEKEKERERNNGWGIVRRTSSIGASSKEIKLLRIHAPYQDYMSFIAHLRLLHLSTQNPPAMSTLLPLPFLARLLTEDSEPTVRLDLAPSLNWLSRRSVLSAIHSGQLRIEPISITTLLNDPNTNINPESVSCALCGCPLFPSASTSGPPAPGHGHQHTPSNTSTASSWSTAGAAKFFRKPSLQLGLSQNSPSSPTTTPSLPPFLSSSANSTQGRRISTSAASLLENQPNAQVFIFRLSTSANTGGPNLPIPKSISASSSSSTATPSTTSSPYSSFPLSSISLSLPSGSSSLTPTPTPPTTSHQHTSSLSQSTSTIYPLCTSNWCLARLRTTCILWAFVRTGIVERVWEEELPEPAPLSADLSGSTTGQSGGLAPGKIERSKSATTTAEVKANGTKGTGTGQPPPVPPRRRGLWSLASAIGERAASWGDKDKEKKAGEESTSAQAPSVPSKDASPEASVAAVQSTESTAPSTAPASTSPAAPSLTAAPIAAAISPSPTSTSAPPPAPPPIPPRRADIRTQASTPPPAPPRSPIRVSSPSSPLRASSPTPKSPIRASSPLATTTSKTVHTRNASLSTAIGVPLPPSRPGTPSQILVPATGAVAPTVSRPTTPQAGGTAPVVGGSPAPPPIPRRAAARTKVIAVAEEAENKVEERKDETGKTAAVPEAATKENKKEEDGAIEISDSDDDDDKASVTTAPDGVAVAPEVEKPVETTTAEAKTEVVAEKVDEKKEEEIEPTVQPTKSSTKPEAEETDPFMSAAEKANASAEASESSRPSQEITTEPQSITSRTSLADDEEVNPNYTYDITWEERTWREVVRLREDMFWARVGGVKE
ncbi:hypothetical protein CPB83DRAFT_853949 [Crepidotus variabilis]|uniref:GDP/GTP exchange factor Sec2 N-terminal domain-containing protein n=1 Tax=Crepidotus variabilis TaxID=179855 RepID=A0A9P6EGR8_9AGAR|nr:hypothetical protein CPB83DRAFT_853949 [Crepidotus variabilis]